MIINKKILAIIILITIGLIGFTMMFMYARLVFYLLLGCVALTSLLSWCIMALDDEI
jgi:hypothetical protein